MCRGEGGNRMRVWTKGAGAGASNGKRQYKNQRAKLRPVRSTARPKSGECEEERGADLLCLNYLWSRRVAESMGALAFCPRSGASSPHPSGVILGET